MAPNTQVQQRLLELAREIFDDWQRILSVSLRKEGVTPARARVGSPRLWLPQWKARWRFAEPHAARSP